MKKAFENLRNRFGLRKIAVVGGVALILSAALVANGISGALQVARVNDALSSADNFLKQGDWLAARQVLEKAKDELSTSVPELTIKSLNNKIDALEESQQSYSKAESLKKERKHLASIVEYSKVLVADVSRYEMALEEIKILQPLAIDDALQEGQALSRNKKFQEAVSLIDQTIKIAGTDTRLVSARAEYSQARTAQIQAQAAENKRIRAAALSKMRKKYDSFESMTWYRDLSSPTYSNRNAFYLTFGASGTTKYSLWLKVTYFDDDWLFVNQARVNVDGVIYDLSCSNWERDNNSDIWEWCDIQLDDRGMIEAIIKSKKAVIRFDGSKYYDTRTITSTQKQALRNVLKAYDAY
jgi:tetratricopeptide (TPR) repeat protein